MMVMGYLGEPCFLTNDQLHDAQPIAVQHFNAMSPTNPQPRQKPDPVARAVRIFADLGESRHTESNFCFSLAHGFHQA